MKSHGAIAACLEAWPQCRHCPAARPVSCSRSTLPSHPSCSMDNKTSQSEALALQRCTETPAHTVYHESLIRLSFFSSHHLPMQRPLLSLWYLIPALPYSPCSLHTSLGVSKLWFSLGATGHHVKDEKNGYFIYRIFEELKWHLPIMNLVMHTSPTQKADWRNSICICMPCMGTLWEKDVSQMKMCKNMFFCPNLIWCRWWYTTDVAITTSFLFILPFPKLWSR